MGPPRDLSLSAYAAFWSDFVGLRKRLAVNAVLHRRLDDFGVAATDILDRLFEVWCAV